MEREMENKGTREQGDREKNERGERREWAGVGYHGN